MTDKQDRRTQSLADIKALVSGRSEVLSLYAGLAEHRPYSENKNFAEELEKFSEALIDYTAGAHFQLYRHLAESTERRKSVLEVADQSYEKIVKTTDQILEFNDRYGDCKELDVHAGHLETDLSLLGEILADRIQYEDQMIGALEGNRSVN